MPESPCAGVFSAFPSVFEPCRGLWNIVVIWRCWKSLLDLFISKAVVESQFLFIIFWAVLSLESLAMLWTCSLYQNESISHFFGIFPQVFGKSHVSGYYFLKWQFSQEWLVEFQWNFVRIFAQLVCIDSDTKKRGSITVEPLLTHTSHNP